MINHLWQSTVFAILAGLLTLAFRRNRTQVRYWRVLSVWRSLASLGVSLLLLVALLGVCGIGIAQTSVPLPKFEVASIRPEKPGMRLSGMESPPGRFSATNVTAKSLIAYAYNYHQPGRSLLDSQILGGPKWINSDRFDIDAKVEDSLVEQDEKKKLPQNEWWDQVRLMLQSMLADRFKLKVTQETKELPIYVLVVAKHGPKLTKSTVPRIWRISAARGPEFRFERGQFTGDALSTSDLAGLLSYLPEIGGREVIDQTGLQGRYDFTLKWTPEQGQRFARPRPSGAAGEGGGADHAGAGGAIKRMRAAKAG